jgi:hypothetical protein
MHKYAQRTVVCDASGFHADLAAVDALARLRLVAGRFGIDLRVKDASPELRALLDLCGLAGELLVEPRGCAEQLEQPLGVEEEGHLGDGAA